MKTRARRDDGLISLDFAATQAVVEIVDSDDEEVDERDFNRYDNHPSQEDEESEEETEATRAKRLKDTAPGGRREGFRSAGVELGRENDKLNKSDDSSDEDSSDDEVLVGDYVAPLKGLTPDAEEVEEGDEDADIEMEMEMEEQENQEEMLEDRMEVEEEEEEEVVVSKDKSKQPLFAPCRIEIDDCSESEEELPDLRVAPVPSKPATINQPKAAPPSKPYSGPKIISLVAPIRKS